MTPGYEMSTRETVLASVGEAPAVSLKKNFAVTLAGNFAYGGAQWAMLMVIAKLGTPEMLGRFALALAVTAPLIEFSNLNLRSVLATDVRQDYAFGEYLALRLLMLGGALALIGILAFAAGYDRESASIIAMVGLAKAVEAVSDIFFGLMQRREQMARIAASLAVKAVLSLSLFALGMHATRSLKGGVAFLLGSWLLSLLGWDLRNAASSFEDASSRPSFRPRWSGDRLGRLFHAALPLGIAALLTALAVSIPRYFVGGMLGERGLGFFAAMAYVPIAGARVINALGTSAVARLARHHHHGDLLGYRGLLLKILAVGLAIGAGGLALAVFAGDGILTLLYRSEYAVSLDAFVWIMCAASISYLSLFLEFALTAAGWFWAQSVAVALASAVIGAACVLLIPHHGLTGAAMALAAGALAQASADAFFTWRVLRNLGAGGGR